MAMSVGMATRSVPPLRGWPAAGWLVGAAAGALVGAGAAATAPDAGVGAVLAAVGAAPAGAPLVAGVVAAPAGAGGGAVVGLHAASSATPALPTSQRSADRRCSIGVGCSSVDR